MSTGVPTGPSLEPVAVRSVTVLLVTAAPLTLLGDPAAEACDGDGCVLPGAR